MIETMQNVPLYLLILALAVYAWRWRSTALREMQARQAVDIRLNNIKSMITRNYVQARTRRLENSMSEEQEHERHHVQGLGPQARRH